MYILRPDPPAQTFEGAYGNEFPPDWLAYEGALFTRTDQGGRVYRRTAGAWVEVEDFATDVFEREVTITELRAITSTPLVFIPAITGVLLVIRWIEWSKPDGSALTANGLTSLGMFNGAGAEQARGQATLLTSAPPRTQFSPFANSGASFTPRGAWIETEYGTDLHLQGAGGDPTGGAGSLFMLMRYSRVPLGNYTRF